LASTPSSSSKHLIIDGYNIIYAWPDLAKILREDGPDRARDQLAQRIRVIHDIESLRTTLVFDGQGKEIQITRPTKELSFSLVFSPARTSADGIIEQLVANSKKPADVTVATGDRALETLISKSGCYVLTPQALLDWIIRCQNTQIELLNKTKKKALTTWKHIINPWDKIN